MKSLCIFFTLSIFVSINSSLLLAQNIAPYWSLTGNNNATATSKLGTTNSVNLGLFTNNLERMRLTTTGNVGINTTNPLTKFHVNGAGSFGANVTIANATRVLNLVDPNAVMRILRVHPTAAPAVELISRTSSDGPNVAYWDCYAEPTDASFRIRDRRVAAPGFDRLKIDLNGNVGIGTTSPTAKLQVESSDVAILGNGYNAVQGNGDYIGVHGTAKTYGVIGASNQIGVAGLGDLYGTYGTSINIGVYGAGNYVGVWGITSDPSAWAGYFQGDVYTNGSYLSSDRKLKTDITDVTSAMELIKKLQPKSYTFRQDGNYKPMNLPAGKHYGLIAQDVEQVLPNLVKATTFEPGRFAKPEPGAKLMKQASMPSMETIVFKALNYTELIPIVIKGMQELDEENKEKENRIIQLEAELADLRQIVLNMKNDKTWSNTSTSKSSFLEQNIPNPVSGNTTIRYQIPVTTTSAKVTITNIKAQLIKAITIGSMGAGQVNFNSATLATGTYNYSLWVDGKQVDTKRLIIAR